MRVYNDELYHWGVKGMKWGVRRYQKSDGTLTSAGKKRYGISLETVAKTQNVHPKSAKNRKAKNMSDEELNQRIARLQKEKQYQDLKKATSPGKAYVTDLLKTSGNKVIGGAAGAIGGMAGKIAVDAVMNHYGGIAVSAVK